MVMGMTDALTATARRLPTLTLLAVAGAVGACDDYATCDAPAAALLEGAPRLLSQTGIDGAVPYEVRYPLYTDGAAKRRWIRLPSGVAVDRTDPDEWRFPPGTRLFKEFSRDGRVIETRMLEFRGPDEGDWLMVAYVWNLDGSDASLAVDGAENALGTAHDVPAARDCHACHDGRRNRVLGYSAVQLGELVPPGTDADRAALGYLHANCSHCHNAVRPPPLAGAARCFNPQNPLDFRILAADTSEVTSTAAYRTAVVATQDLRPGNPGGSHAIALMRGQGFGGERMPPLGTEQLDTEGIATLETWVRSLRP